MSGGFAAWIKRSNERSRVRAVQTSPAIKRSFAQNRQLAAEAGRKGGQSVAAQDRSSLKTASSP